MIQELRIGNWIMGELGNEMTVCSLYKNSIECDFDGGWCSVFCPKPIPLSKEILEKCGFSFKPIGEEAYEQFWILDGFTVWQHDKGFCHDYHHGGNIFYLHDLQNLYYALTKQELEYKP